MREVPVLDHAQIHRLKEWGGADLQRKMIDLFLTHARERVAQIKEGLTEQESRKAETGAHTLKSSAGNVGARRLQELSADAEALAEKGELPSLQELFPSIEREFEAACEALRIVMKELPE
jgi:HPt (histidine-containing phosphotransfer) domain-containing protein